VFFGVIGLFPWKKFENKSRGIEKASCLTSPDVIAYSFLRIIFLAVYEWFFRGLMLTEFTTWLGMTGGIVINILLYALIHSHKDKKEILGSVPLGMVLCVFTLWWHSIWPAVIFHLEIAFINESPVLQKFISPKKQAAL